MGIAETRSTGQEVASAQTLKQPAGHTNFPDPDVTPDAALRRAARPARLSGTRVPRWRRSISTVERDGGSVDPLIPAPILGPPEWRSFTAAVPKKMPARAPAESSVVFEAWPNLRGLHRNLWRYFRSLKQACQLTAISCCRSGNPSKSSARRAVSPRCSRWRFWRTDFGSMRELLPVKQVPLCQLHAPLT